MTGEDELLEKSGFLQAPPSSRVHGVIKLARGEKMPFSTCFLVTAARHDLRGLSPGLFEMRG